MTALLRRLWSAFLARLARDAEQADGIAEDMRQLPRELTPVTLDGLSKEYFHLWGKHVGWGGFHNGRWGDEGRFIGLAEDDSDYYYVIQRDDLTISWCSAVGGIEAIPSPADPHLADVVRDGDMAARE